MNNMVNDLFAGFDKMLGYPLPSKNKNDNYKIDSDDGGVTLTMNVPGYNKKLIDVTVEDNSLVIVGNVNSGDTDGFSHKFTIGEKLDIENISATVVDGVLTVSLPYREEVKPRKIEVKVK
jgi:HSP20 family protein